MNAGEILIAAVGAVGGVGGAVFAWVQAKAAVGSRRDAQDAQAEAEAAQRRAEAARDEALELSRKATQAAQRQAAALEEANRLEAEARRPKTWTGPNVESDKELSWLNTSGEDITVLRTEVLPADTAGMVRKRMPSSFPGVVPAGGRLLVWRVRASGKRPEVLVVEYELAGTSGVQRINLPLS